VLLFRCQADVISQWVCIFAHYGSFNSGATTTLYITLNPSSGSPIQYSKQQRQHHSFPPTTSTVFLHSYTTVNPFKKKEKKIVNKNITKQNKTGYAVSRSLCYVNAVSSHTILLIDGRVGSGRFGSGSSLIN
jgi:hypothetical protein